MQQNLKTQTVTKLKNPNCEKLKRTQILTKLKKHQTVTKLKERKKCGKTQELKL